MRVTNKDAWPGSLYCNRKFKANYNLREFGRTLNNNCILFIDFFFFTSVMSINIIQAYDFLSILHSYVVK